MASKKKKIEVQKVERKVSDTARSLEERVEKDPNLFEQDPNTARSLEERVAEKDLTFEQQQPDPMYLDESAAPEYVVTTPISTHIRSAPEAGGSIMGVYAQGTKLQVMSKENNGWISVRTDTHPAVRGYIRVAYVRKVEA